MQMIQIMDNFNIKGSIVHAQEYGNGHINKTYLVRTTENERFILQQINTSIFKKPKEVMENIELVTMHIRKKCVKNGHKDPSRLALEIVSSKDKKNYIKLRDSYWRLYRFIEGARTYETIDNPKHFYEAGKAVGVFQKQLCDFPIKKLNITIPDFHDTPKRYDKFVDVANKDEFDRGLDIFNEIKFIFDRRGDMDLIMDALKHKKIPTRVTHNDTKLNNIMFDEQTDEAICIIDLDTVMPGSVLFDFGDAIRIGASTALEDEKDLSKVKLDLDLFSKFTEGFLEILKHDLKKEEMTLLVDSAKIITLECGMRFLTDYLSGDKYFKIDYEDHNLVRARTQIKLVQEIEEKYDQMQEIVQNIINKK